MINIAQLMNKIAIFFVVFLVLFSASVFFKTTKLSRCRRMAVTIPSQSREVQIAIMK